MSGEGGTRAGPLNVRATSHHGVWNGARRETRVPNVLALALRDPDVRRAFGAPTIYGLHHPPSFLDVQRRWPNDLRAFLNEVRLGEGPLALAARPFAMPLPTWMDSTRDGTAAPIHPSDDVIWFEGLSGARDRYCANRSELRIGRARPRAPGTNSVTRCVRRCAAGRCSGGHRRDRLGAPPAGLSRCRRSSPGVCARTSRRRWRGRRRGRPAWGSGVAPAAGSGAVRGVP
jgi:hypothetical protein